VPRVLNPVADYDSVTDTDENPQCERGYWTPQILPPNSPFHRPLTPNTLLGSFQTMNGPAKISS